MACLTASIGTWRTKVSDTQVTGTCHQLDLQLKTTEKVPVTSALEVSDTQVTGTFFADFLRA